MHRRNKKVDTVSLTERSLIELVEEGEICVGSTRIEIMSNKSFSIAEE